MVFQLAFKSRTEWCNKNLIFLFFSGSGSSNLKQPDHGNSRRKSLIAAAISLRQRKMMAFSKAHDPIHQFAWLLTDQTDDKAVKVAAPQAPLDLRQDLMAPT